MSVHSWSRTIPPGHHVDDVEVVGATITDLLREMQSDKEDQPIEWGFLQIHLDDTRRGVIITATDDEDGL